MKHAARKTTSVLLSALLLGSGCLMGVSANTVSTDPVSVDMEKSGFSETDGRFNIYLTINETAGNDVSVSLSDAILDVMTAYAQQYGYDSYPVQPGDSNPITVTITNNSDKIYKYADDSFTLTPAKYGAMSDFIGYDGEAFPSPIFPVLLPQAKPFTKIYLIKVRTVTSLLPTCLVSMTSWRKKTTPAITL